MTTQLPLLLPATTVNVIIIIASALVTRACPPTGLPHRRRRHPFGYRYRRTTAITSDEQQQRITRRLI
jgi:hypothetical protein